MSALDNATARTSSPALSAAQLDAIKARQQATWASGDFSIVGTTLQIVGEFALRKAVDLRAGSRKVLDVAAGNGNSSLAAAACRCCDVTSTDYAPSPARGRPPPAPEADRLADPSSSRPTPRRCRSADQSFDVVLSSFGVMFAPEPRARRSETPCVSRRRGGRIGLANWTLAGIHRQAVRRWSAGTCRHQRGSRLPSRWGAEDSPRSPAPQAARRRGIHATPSRLRLPVPVAERHIGIDVVQDAVRPGAQGVRGPVHRGAATAGAGSASPDLRVQHER